jgi:hypothetical protein
VLEPLLGRFFGRDVDEPAAARIRARRCRHPTRAEIDQVEGKAVEKRDQVMLRIRPHTGVIVRTGQCVRIFLTRPSCGKLRHLDLGRSDFLGRFTEIQGNLRFDFMSARKPFKERGVVSAIRLPFAQSGPLVALSIEERPILDVAARPRHPWL